MNKNQNFLFLNERYETTKNERLNAFENSAYSKLEYIVILVSVHKSDAVNSVPRIGVALVPYLWSALNYLTYTNSGRTLHMNKLPTK
jgi:hypothetical protein